jgi:hypothetical protein
MGTWGYGIFDDDIASDIRNIFEDAIGEGLDVDSATQRVFDEFGEIASDDDEGPVIWFSVAALQLDHGALRSDARERALSLIEPDLERWEEAGPDEVAQRKAVLEDLRVRIERAS